MVIRVVLLRERPELLSPSASSSGSSLLYREEDLYLGPLDAKDADIETEAIVMMMNTDKDKDAEIVTDKNAVWDEDEGSNIPPQQQRVQRWIEVVVVVMMVVVVVVIAAAVCSSGSSGRSSSGGSCCFCCSLACLFVYLFLGLFSSAPFRGREL